MICKWQYHWSKIWQKLTDFYNKNIFRPLVFWIPLCDPHRAYLDTLLVVTSIYIYILVTYFTYFTNIYIHIYIDIYIYIYIYIYHIHTAVVSFLAKFILGGLALGKKWGLSSSRIQKHYVLCDGVVVCFQLWRSLALLTFDLSGLLLF